MAIRRWDLNGVDSEMDDSPNGEYVLYEDYLAEKNASTGLLDLLRTTLVGIRWLGPNEKRDIVDYVGDEIERRANLLKGSGDGDKAL